MRMQPETGTTPNPTLTVLSISPNAEDHSVLEGIVSHSQWTLLKTNNLFSARAVLLQRRDISVVLCEKDLTTGTWIDIFKDIQPMPHPPSLIVTSRLPDEHLWAEALNLGAWDVLATPFDRSEVLYSIRSAWDHWHRYRESATPPKVMKAAS